MVGGRVPSGPLRAHVRSIARPYSVDRYRGHTNDVAGGGKQYETDAVTVDAYLYDATGGRDIQGVGEVEQGQLSGLAVADADIQVRDRFEERGKRYEVLEPIRKVPSPQRPVVIQFPLQRVSFESL